MKLVYMDLEFTGLHKNTNLVSIGLVSEDGATFYAESTEYSCPLDFATRDDLDFFNNRVKPNLKFYDSGENTVRMAEGGNGWEVVGRKTFIKDCVEEWFKVVCDAEEPAPNSIQIVGDVCTFDWVLFCDLWEHALSIPPFIFYIPFDIATMLPICGLSADVSRESLISLEGLDSDSKHNALYDAQVIRLIHQKLQNDYAARTDR